MCLASHRTSREAGWLGNDHGEAGEGVVKSEGRWAPSLGPWVPR